MKPMKETPVKPRRKFDETFKQEAVQNWRPSGKSAEVIAEELGLGANLFYNWKKLFAASAVGGRPAREPPFARAARHFKKTSGLLSEPSGNATNGSLR